MYLTHECPFMFRKMGATILVALIAHHTSTVAFLVALPGFTWKIFWPESSLLHWTEAKIHCRTEGVWSIFIRYVLRDRTSTHNSVSFRISVTEIMNLSCLMWSKVHTWALCLFLPSREEPVARKIFTQIYVALPVATAFCILFWAVSDIRKSWDPLPLQTQLGWNPHIYELAGISVSGARSDSPIDSSNKTFNIHTVIPIYEWTQETIYESWTCAYPAFCRYLQRITNKYIMYLVLNCIWKLLYVSMRQRIITREFFCYTKLHSS